MLFINYISLILKCPLYLNSENKHVQYVKQKKSNGEHATSKNSCSSKNSNSSKNSCSSMNSSHLHCLGWQSMTGAKVNTNTKAMFKLSAVYSLYISYFS